MIQLLAYLLAATAVLTCIPVIVLPPEQAVYGAVAFAVGVWLLFLYLFGDLLWKFICFHVRKLSCCKPKRPPIKKFHPSQNRFALPPRRSGAFPPPKELEACRSRAPNCDQTESSDQSHLFPTSFHATTPVLGLSEEQAGQDVLV